MNGKFNTTTKDVGLLYQLYTEGQLSLSPEFQRNSVWPRPARAYLIDTILEEQPIPVLYLQREYSAQTNRQTYAVIDGQQRLNSLFQFMENRFALTQSNSDRPWFGKRWKTLTPEDREKIINYSFTVYEMSGYSPSDIRDMFRRMNRYVVALNPQEHRHSSDPGKFKSLVEEVATWEYWADNKVITGAAASRMRDQEFSAELLILINEGPQDKKSSINLYYTNYQEEFTPADALKHRLENLLDSTTRIVENLAQSVWRNPAYLYGLVGALAELQDDEETSLPEEGLVRERLTRFTSDLQLPEERRSRRASEFLLSSSRQTDNIKPRQARIAVIKAVMTDES